MTVVTERLRRLQRESCRQCIRSAAERAFYVTDMRTYDMHSGIRPMIDLGILGLFRVEREHKSRGLEVCGNDFLVLIPFALPSNHFHSHPFPFPFPAATTYR